MDARGISAILLKVAGLILIGICVAQLPAYFQLVNRGIEWSLADALLTTAVSLGPLAILGIGLWFFPGTIANRIVVPDASPSSSFDARAIEVIALTVLGIYILAWGLIDVVRDVFYVVAIQRQSPESALIPASVVGRIAASLVQLFIGAWLCIGAKGVSRVIERLRG